MHRTSSCFLFAWSCLALTAPCLAQYGQFDRTEVRPADEAIVMTPAGFNKSGKPAVATGDEGIVRVRVLNGADGQPTPCRVNVVGWDGDFYQPKDNPLAPYSLTGAWPNTGRGNRVGKAPIRYFGAFFYTTGEFTVEVPLGATRIEVWKGFDWRPASTTVQATKANPIDVAIKLVKDPKTEKHHYFSGDPHLHFPRGNDKDDAAVFDLLEAEDVRFGWILCYNNDTAAYSGVMDRQDSPQRRGLGPKSLRIRHGYAIESGQEYRSNVYGHQLHFGPESMVLANENLDPNRWPVFGILGERTIKSGGTVVYAHGGYSQEIFADVPRGDVSGVELFQFGIYRGLGLDGWYQLLNAGYQFPACGASDYPACRKLGDCRTYVNIDGEPTMEAWTKGLAEGRSFVSSGPLLFLTVNDRKPGSKLYFDGGPSRRVNVSAQLVSPTADVTDLEIIVNGRVERRCKIDPLQGRNAGMQWDASIELDRSSWIAARAYSKSSTGAPDADAHTNPVYVYLQGRTPFDKASVDRLVAKLDEAVAFHARREFPGKDKVLDYFRGSRELLVKLAKDGGRPAPPEPIANLLQPLPAKTPAEALKTIETIPGFKVELAAAEPLTTDPCAGAFDENGRLYVCELTDYPFKPEKGEEPLGKVRLLEDVDGDGRFDRSEVFADKLLWPAGVACWKGGVFVAAAPNIYYFKDVDGDRKADVRKIVFSGFGTKNQQAMVNNLVWGLDQWIYGSAAHNGGEIRPGDRPGDKAVSIRGADFRFHPVTGAFELVSGTAQFGNTFDDFYNRFVCSESEPCYHVLLPRRYLARNPYLPAPGPLLDLAPGTTPVFRTSAIEGWRKIRTDRRLSAGERAASSAGASHDVIDGGAGATIYRGNLFPPEFRGSLFICDAQNNLVHRRKLTPSGVTFTSSRADEGTEFLRSSDNWFRPVNLINGPEGALYVLDMSREIIESIHIPTDVFQQLDLTRGRDQGRIYRIVPSTGNIPQKPMLGGTSSRELVAMLAHDDAWTRETAQRLLYERQDLSIVDELRILAANGPNPVAKLHAWAALSGLGVLSDEKLMDALSDRQPAPIREWAVRSAEPRLAKSPPLANKVAQRADDADKRVRFQTAFTLGEWNNPRAVDALAKIAESDGDDPWMRTALLSSTAQTADQLLVLLLASRQGDALHALIERCALIVGVRNRQPELARVLAILEKQNLDASRRVSVLLGLGDGLHRAGTTLPEDNAVVQSAIQEASAQILNDKVRMSDRLTAIKLLSFARFTSARDVLKKALEPGRPDAVRLTTIEALGAFSSPEIASDLLEGWKSYSPKLRDEAAQQLVSRPVWIEALLQAVEEGRVAPSQLLPAQRTILRTHRDQAVRDRFEKIFAEHKSPRKEVIAKYRAALTTQGDAARGEKVFERTCMNCHRIAGKGFEVGPNLTTTRFRARDAVLQHILEPNLEVQPAYLGYVVVETDGKISTGLLAAESDVSLTLKGEQGKVLKLLKTNIEEISNTGKSLMPEGVEKDVSIPQMADLLAFLEAAHYDIGSEPGAAPPTQRTGGASSPPRGASGGSSKNRAVEGASP